MSTEMEEAAGENELVELEDLEAAAAEGRAPRRARQYRIRVDQEQLVFDTTAATGREILQRVGKTPAEKFLLVQRLRGGGTRTIAPDQTVDFTTPGVERFTTLPRDQTDGEGELRKQFALAEGDRACLDAKARPWETVLERRARWLLVHDVPVPDGYAVQRVTVALNVPAGYPDAQIDMAYFYPHLRRADGKAIAALAEQVIDGRRFQRWSRHRTATNPWRPGVDDVCTHLALVSDWLEREFAVVAR